MNKYRSYVILAVLLGLALVTLTSAKFGSQFLTLQSYPEPTGPELDDHGLAGFYDKTNTTVRPIREDLIGVLTGMVQFVQSHSVEPEGAINQNRRMPNVTAERAALLLVTPSESFADITALTVTPSVNGVAKAALTLKHPNYMPRSDYKANNRPDYIYSRRSWFIELPWDIMVPGLSLSVVDNQNRSGVLAKEKISWGPPSELFVHSIRLGMLTNPPTFNSWQHGMLANPADRASDYFQTIPAAQMTVSSYDARTLPRVMVGSGVIYTNQSASINADVYTGDMRENTAKSTVSTGINMANYGSTCSGMISQSQPQLFQNVVAHHARGRYTNPETGGPVDVNHGLSGGNGILTLDATVGNEFSHEIGHHYGLGHYPGSESVPGGGTSYFWAAHHHDSGWGYISYRNRMRANIHWTRGVDDRMNQTSVLDNIYSFCSDAMSGGHHDSGLSSYTHYTGYSTWRSIQNSLAQAVPSPTSKTGWLRWNGTSLAMEDYTANVPTASDQYWNSKDGKYLKPREYGVPVWTILGGYDPLRGSAVLYEPFRGNWGLVYDHPARQHAAGVHDGQCWLTVSFSDGTAKDISLSANVLQRDSVNKIHVNVAQSENPIFVQLKCQESHSRTISILDSVVFPTQVPEVAPAVIVGRDHAYNRLREQEIVEYNNILEAMQNDAIIALTTRGLILHNSWGHVDLATVPDLSSKAAEVRSRYLKQEDSFYRVNRWMAKYRPELESASNAAAVIAFKNLLTTLDLNQDPVIPLKQQMKLNNGNCIKHETVDKVSSVYIARAQNCTNAEDEQWVIDGFGNIHRGNNYAHCLAVNGNNAWLTDCKASANQVFTTDPNDNTHPIKTQGACLDHKAGAFSETGRGTLITYGCNQGTNQRWPGFTSNSNKLLAGLNAANLFTLTKLNL